MSQPTGDQFKRTLSIHVAVEVMISAALCRSTETKHKIVGAKVVPRCFLASRAIILLVAFMLTTVRGLKSAYSLFSITDVRLGKHLSPALLQQSGVRHSRQIYCSVVNLPSDCNLMSRQSSLGGASRRVRSVSWMAGFGKIISGATNTLRNVDDEKDPGAVQGTNLRILKYPHPKLRAENARVDVFDAELIKTAEEMLMIMYASDGVGLAAPQVGINKRLMVFNEKGDGSEKDYEMILINPEIVDRSEEVEEGEEGCLSFPQIRGSVQRNKWIEVKHDDVDGNPVRTRFEGWPAVIFQHEYDHLDKVLFIDRFDEKDKKTNKRRLEKLVKKYGPGGAV